MIIKNDKQNNFKSMFDPNTGFYLRTGILDETGKDTGIDPFKAAYPELIDVGIMQTCVCSNKCTIDCYQKAATRTGSNMSLENFESICKQSSGKCFSFALGGAGDVDTHSNFEEILKMCRTYNIVPNFTTSGILLDDKKAQICKKYCGSVAVSQHTPLKKVILMKEKKYLTPIDNELPIYIETFANINKMLNNNWYITDKVVEDLNWIYKEVFFEEDGYTYNAIKTLLDANVQTNIHYVLNKKSINEAIIRLKNNAFPKGINAVVFLLYKPIGFGKKENILTIENEKVQEFFELIDKKHSFKIGFDSCSCAGLINFSNKIILNTMDYCEGARFSAYIDANMNMMPCSFANQNSSWHMNLKDHTIEEVWNSEIFEKFRNPLKNSCKDCKDKTLCGGGCPLVNEITLCNRKERKFTP